MLSVYLRQLLHNTVYRHDRKALARFHTCGEYIAIYNNIIISHPRVIPRAFLESLNPSADYRYISCLFTLLSSHIKWYAVIVMKITVVAVIVMNVTVVSLFQVYMTRTLRKLLALLPSKSFLNLYILNETNSGIRNIDFSLVFLTCR